MSIRLSECFILGQFIWAMCPFHAVGECKTHSLSSRWCCRSFFEALLHKISKRSSTNFFHGRKKSFFQQYICFEFELNRPRIAGLRTERSPTVSGPCFFLTHCNCKKCSYGQTNKNNTKSRGNRIECALFP